MQLLAYQVASAAFAAWASAVPCQPAVASVEPDLVVAVAAAVEEPAGLVGAFLVAGGHPAAAVAVEAVVAAAAAGVVVAAVVAVGMDNYSPADDSIQPTGLCSPVEQQQLPSLLL